jgi:tetratricopeptide (TPR) repeat protein
MLVVTSCAPKADGAEQAPQTVVNIGYFEGRIQRDPYDFIAHAALGREYAQRGRETGDIRHYERALRSLEKSLAIMPDDYTALAQMASILNTHHRFADAKPLAEKAIALKPNKGLGYAALGDAELELGNPEAAKAAYLKVAELEPSLASYSRLARFYQNKGDYPTARSYWQKALESSAGAPIENIAWIAVQLGHMTIDEGDTAQAKVEFDAALRRFPNFIHAIAGLGRAYAAEGNHKKAVSYYKKALRQRELPEYVIALGDSYLALGRAKDAHFAYGKVEALYAFYEENGINTDIQMAVFAGDHGDPAVGLARGRAAWAARHDFVAADALAWALYKAGDYAEAKEYTEIALKEVANNPLYLFHAGMTAYRLGDAQTARAHLTEALSLNPNFSPLYAKEAKTTLASLK